MIVNTTLQGHIVVAELDRYDDFAMAILEMNLQIAYPDSSVIVEPVNTNTSTVIKIRFTNQEDALHFILSH